MTAAPPPSAVPERPAARLLGIHPHRADAESPGDEPPRDADRQWDAAVIAGTVPASSTGWPDAGKNDVRCTSETCAFDGSMRCLIHVHLFLP